MKIILHIGQSKTGTSAIQAYLTINKEKLLEQGFYFPMIRASGIQLNSGSHNSLADAVTGKKSFPYVEHTNFLNECISHAEKNNIETILFSAEHFFGGEPRIWNLKSVNEYMPLYAEKVKKVKKWLSGHDVSIILYLRPQVDWLASSVGQCVKHEKLITQKEIFKTDEMVFELLKPLLDYNKLANIWGDAFGFDAVQIGIYNKSSLISGDAVSDFLYRIGADRSQLPAPPRQSVNRSFSAIQIAVKRVLNATKKTKHQERVAISCLESISDRLDSEPHKIDLELAQRIKKDLSQDNEQMCLSFKLPREILPVSTGHYVKESASISENQVKAALEVYKHQRGKIKYTIMEYNLIARQFLRDNLPALHAVLHRVKWRISRWRNEK